MGKLIAMIPILAMGFVMIVRAGVVMFIFLQSHG